MPELAEIHLYASRINDLAAGVLFDRIWIPGNPLGPDLSTMLKSDKFEVVASARGKELMLRFNSVNAGQTNETSFTAVFTFGLVGCWNSNTRGGSAPSDAAFAILTQDLCLYLVDNMRMSRWRIGEFDSINRGPDPLDEYSKFVENIKNVDLNWKVFKKPFYELLLNQKYFNGIGNYLRAEIMYQAVKQNLIDDPLESAEEILKQPNINELLKLCSSVPNEVVYLKLNKYGDPEERGKWEEWTKCYQKGKFLEDSQKRKFYYITPEHRNTTEPTESQNNDEESSKSSNTIDGTQLKKALLAISVVFQTKRVSKEEKGWLKDQALLGNHLFFETLEAFEADPDKDFDELADSWKRLNRLSLER